MAAAISCRHRDNGRQADWLAGPRCCGYGTAGRGNPRARDCRRLRRRAGRRCCAATLNRIPQSSNSASSSAPGKPSCRRSLLSCCGVASCGQRRRDLWVANPEQRAGARQFQDHIVAAPPQIGEPRQRDPLGSAPSFGDLRPVVRHLRFDDDLIVAAASRGPSRYSRRPRRASRRTRRSISLSAVLPCCGKRTERQAVAQAPARDRWQPALNFPKPTE